MNQVSELVKSNQNNKSLHESAIAYTKSGIMTFPLLSGKKDPMPPRGYLDATTNLSVNNHWWTSYPEANIGIPTGKANEFFVLDVDIKNGINGESTLSELEHENGALPETLEQRTPSGGRHLFFKYPIGGIRTRVGFLPGLDSRGDGGYVVVAPSRVDGGQYEFSNPGTDIVEAPEWLIELINQRGKRRADEPVREGGRNAHVFRESVKARKDNVPYEEAVQIANAANLQCVPPLDPQEVQRTLESAYRYEPSEIPPEIQQMNRDHAVVWVNGKCRVLRETVDQIYGNRDVEFLQTKDFKDFYSNRYIKIDDKNKPLGYAWLAHPKRREYRDVGFYPKGAPEGVYNLWGGFAVERVEGDCSLFLKHIEENIASGDKAIFDYIIAWMADVVQKPDRLVGTALVLRGSQGVGKGVFANHFGSLFGKHFISLCQSNQLVGRFNGHLKDKVLLLADEAFWGGDKQAEGTLKSMVTEPYLTVEEKGMNAVTMKNHLHMIFSTNNDWAVPAGAQERRFFVIDVSDKRMQDATYFGAITKQMDNGGREALLYYLMNYDLNDINLRSFPQTNALWETKYLSFNPVQKFWYHVLETGNLNPEDSHLDGWYDGEIEKGLLYQKYQEFVTNLGVKHKTSPQDLGTNLSKLVKGLKDYRKTNGRRERVYLFPELDKCRERFCELMNYQIEWIMEEEDNQN